MSETIFIGVAWPYANGSLHLGHVAGCYLPADIFARFNRLQGNKVLMVSGSDEHGTPITITADQKKTTPQAIVDIFNKEHTQNMKQFGISFDLFTRTSTDHHKLVVQDIFKTLLKNNYIYKQEVENYYCEKCKKFLHDRYIEGVCPHCHKEAARGDQCDHCGTLLDVFELEQVVCKLCGGTPIVKTTEHFFFSLSSFETRLLDWIQQKEYWKPNVQKFTYNWLKEGLHDRAITRDMQWGVPIPLEGYDDKRIYVWFDAVSGYFTASKLWAKNQGKPDAWKLWWKNPEAKHYYFLAKDNIPFHSIIWPSILMGYDEDLNLPYDIPANEYLCLKGEQFSKSRCVGIWLPDIIEAFDPDAVRYYLSINMPETKDSNWLWPDFIAKNNDELVGTYGNFVHRVLTFTYNNFGDIPKCGTLTDMDTEARRRIKETSKSVIASLSNCSFKKGLREVMSLAQFGNVYFDQQQPWALIKTDRDRCGTVLHICLELVQALAVFMAPFIPFSSKRLWELLGHKKNLTSWDQAFNDLNVGQSIEKPKPLFTKVSLEECMMETDPFSKLDLRTAKIMKVSDHPNADKLYVLDVDVGALGKRTLVAGLKNHYQKQELEGKTIVIVANLKPAKLRGVESKGMLLAAEDTKGVVSLLKPGEVKPGESVTIKGIPKDVSNILEFDDFMQVKMIVDNKQEISYNNQKIQTDQGPITVDKPVEVGAEVH